jgi:hypothetical protein
MPIKRLENLLKPSDDGGLGDIIRHARDMGELAQILQKSLPGDCSTSISAANIRDNGELIVLASTPAWAAKLRFEANNLIKAARASGAEVTSCRVRVNRNS